MKGYKVNPEMSKATLGIGPQPRDIRWHSGVPLPVKGDYLVEVIVEDNGVYTFYVYWDGENPYVYENNHSDNIYPLENIISWAYDGDET
jgi:hypothetical protein